MTILSDSFFTCQSFRAMSDSTDRTSSMNIYCFRFRISLNCVCFALNFYLACSRSASEVKSHDSSSASSSCSSSFVYKSVASYSIRDNIAATSISSILAVISLTACAQYWFHAYWISCKYYWRLAAALVLIQISSRSFCDLWENWLASNIYLTWVCILAYAFIENDFIYSSDSSFQF